jgi:hypothetical protein
MIISFIDVVTGAPVYVNPSFVVSLRPDPEHPTEDSVVKLSDGEALRVHGEHGQVADKLRSPEA